VELADIAGLQLEFRDSTDGASVACLTLIRANKENPAPFG